MTRLNLDSARSNLELLLTSDQTPRTESIRPEKGNALVLLLIKRIVKFGQLKCKEISLQAGRVKQQILH